jgi:hypothetical protein
MTCRHAQWLKSDKEKIRLSQTTNTESTNPALTQTATPQNLATRHQLRPLTPEPGNPTPPPTNPNPSTGASKT